ncbi:MAG TPA: response regulator [Rhodanobacteraceae bacterium]
MRRMLIAEDDDRVRALVGSVLRQDGDKIEFAANGGEALERIQGGDYDCIILDLMMPTASGFEVLAWMHRERRGVAAREVIVLTAMAGQSLSHLTPDRVFAVVRKPFDIDELRETVRRCVSAEQTGA